MVRQPLREIDVKKLKMAKEVLSFLEVLGIKEEDLDNLVNIPSLVSKIESLEKRIEELEEFKTAVIRTSKNEIKGEKSVSEMIKEAFKGGVEEFNPYGR
jgi:hypothetical protein